jgi:hypothetical protein
MPDDRLRRVRPSIDEHSKTDAPAITGGKDIGSLLPLDPQFSCHILEKASFQNVAVA